MILSGRLPSTRRQAVSCRIPPPVHLAPHDQRYPPRLTSVFRGSVPPELVTCGSLELLSAPKLGLLCSARCPGSSILEAYEFVKKMPREGFAVIGGFHSPLERQCLEVLIDRKIPVILCLARPIPSLRIRKEWREPVAEARLLLLTSFARGSRRPTRERAFQRNRIVAALSDTLLVPYARSGGSIERLLVELHLSERDVLHMEDPLMGILSGWPRGGIDAGREFSLEG